jgi:hypothetical protein
MGARAETVVSSRAGWSARMSKSFATKGADARAHVFSTPGCEFTPKSVLKHGWFAPLAS